ARRQRRPWAPALSPARPRASARHSPAPPDRAKAASTPPAGCPLGRSPPPVPESAHRWPPSVRIRAVVAPPPWGCPWDPPPRWPPPLPARARSRSPAAPHPPAGSWASGWYTCRRVPAGQVLGLPLHPPARAAAPPDGLADVVEG